MAIRTQSVLDRIDFATGDTARKRFSLPRIAQFLNEAQSMIAEASPKSSAAYLPITLVAGTQQTLENDTSKSWIRLHEVVCNASAGGLPTGASVRLVSRPQLDQVARNWRAASAGATVEYTMDERDPKAFMVYPPAVAGAKLFALASPRPGPVCVLNGGGTALADANELIGLGDGFDIPMVDWVLYRLFSKDALEPGYQVRAKDHFAAAQGALGVVLQDAG